MKFGFQNFFGFQQRPTFYQETFKPNRNPRGIQEECMSPMEFWDHLESSFILFP
jgi:hypothetical protein